MTSDPLERIRLCLDDAIRERNDIRGHKATADMEISQLRRRLKRAEDGYSELAEQNTELTRQLRRAEQRAEESRRAMRDHAART